MTLKIELEPEIEKKFRETAMKKYGYAKGSLSKGGSAALQKWVKEEDSTIPIVDDPLSLIEGMLKHLRGKYTSVELQHEAVRLWATKK
ncbi:hypothetical protein HYU13_02500 [Candidatus Woesearchaeota archaeon]|nr:hypothetical protein [Candidatus Woesearchaeota archaeon]